MQEPGFRINVFCADRAITCTVRNHVLRVDSVGYMHNPQVPYVYKDDRAIALDIIGSCNEYAVRKIGHSDLLCGVSKFLEKYMHAVHTIQDCILNPHTEAGKRRLMREFELIISDDA